MEAKNGKVPYHTNRLQKSGRPGEREGGEDFIALWGFANDVLLLLPVVHITAPVVPDLPETEESHADNKEVP